MTESHVKDTDSELYPDVLSVNYVTGALTEMPTAHIITAPDLNKFWNYFYDRYQVSYYDDLYLNINGIPYLGMLQPGSILFEPTIDDIAGYPTTKKIGTDPE